METDNQIKRTWWRQKYSEIVSLRTKKPTSRAAAARCCSTEVYNIMSDDCWCTCKATNADADLGLGFRGLSTQFAQIKPEM